MYQTCPQPEAWSIAECADHVLGVERRLFHGQVFRHCAPDPERVARVQGKEERVVAALSDRTFKSAGSVCSEP